MSEIPMPQNAADHQLQITSPPSLRTPGPGRKATEEWETWMQWDGPQDELLLPQDSTDAAMIPFASDITTALPQDENSNQLFPPGSSSSNSLLASPPPLHCISDSHSTTSRSDELDSLPPLSFSPILPLTPSPDSTNFDLNCDFGQDDLIFSKNHQLHQRDKIPLSIEAAKPLSNSSKKRKSSALVDEATPASNPSRTTAASRSVKGGRQPKGQKISHNIIEKRYRSNLNDKIARLRAAIPELRATPVTATSGTRRRNVTTKPASTDSDGSGDDASGAGLKFNKATVLTKATDYIEQLERQNERLLAEVSSLRRRVHTTPRVLVSQPSQPNVNQILPSCNRQEATAVVGCSGIESANSAHNRPQTVVQGIIPVPENMQQLRDQNALNTHYAPADETAIDPTLTDQNLDTTPEISLGQVQGVIPMPEAWRKFRHNHPTSGPNDYNIQPPMVAKAQQPLEVSSPSNAESSIATPQPRSTATAPVPSSSSRNGPLHKHPAPRSTNASADTDGSDSWSRGRAMSRILIGSLAGLMLIEGLSEGESGDGSSQPGGPGKLHARGLFALPTELLTEAPQGFREPIRQRLIAFSVGRAYPILFVSALFLTVALAVFLYLTPTDSKAVREGSSAWEFNPLASRPASPRRRSRVSNDTTNQPSKIKSASPATSPTAGPHSASSTRNPNSTSDGTPGSSSSKLPPNGRKPASQTSSRSTSPERFGTEEFDSALWWIFSPYWREFFARQAVHWLGLSGWLDLAVIDEEAAPTRPPRPGDDYRRRWLTYSQTLPRLLSEEEPPL